MRRNLAFLLTLAAIGLLMAGTMVTAQVPDTAQTTTASETELIDRIRALQPDEGDDSADSQTDSAADRAADLLNTIDSLLSRFPNTSFKGEALIAKLKTMARLAQADPAYVGKLLELTDSIGKTNPRGELASENTYFAVQAFVFAARLEGMSENRRLLGSIERYKAFIEDFPHSPRRPILWASMIRNLIALNQIDRAQLELAAMRIGYPDHSATRRAAGELLRATAVGKPFIMKFTMPDGSLIQTSDYRGRVVVVHFWATWSRESVEGIPRLFDLYKDNRDRGLQLIGVNVDTSPLMAQAALAKFNFPWPQARDDRGFESDLVINSGVVGLPAFFVFDREGIVRSIDPGDQLREVIEPLLEASGASKPTVP